MFLACAKYRLQITAKGHDDVSSEVKKDEGEYQAMQGRSFKTASDTEMLAICDTIPDMLATCDTV